MNFRTEVKRPPPVERDDSPEWVFLAQWTDEDDEIMVIAWFDDEAENIGSHVPADAHQARIEIAPSGSLAFRALLADGMAQLNLRFRDWPDPPQRLVDGVVLKAMSREIVLDWEDVGEEHTAENAFELLCLNARFADALTAIAVALEKRRHG